MIITATSNTCDVFIECQCTAESSVTPRGLTASENLTWAPATMTPGVLETCPPTCPKDYCLCLCATDYSSFNAMMPMTLGEFEGHFCCLKPL